LKKIAFAENQIFIILVPEKKKIFRLPFLFENINISINVYKNKKINKVEKKKKRRRNYIKIIVHLF
jgi:hypothetical protein